MKMYNAVNNAAMRMKITISVRKDDVLTAESCRPRIIHRRCGMIKFCRRGRDRHPSGAAAGPDQRGGYSMPSPGKRLRALIEAPEVLVLPGVFDGFSTRLVSRQGYVAAFITGSGVSETRLGQPDVGLMGLDENVAAARAIAACSELLLLADADTGYGNALNAYHTVRAFERAGVAGLTLEDQAWPKRCGHMRGKEVISAEEMVQKIRAAVEARADPDFVIKSRTDVLATHGVAEAIRRLNLYAEAGADLLFADAAMSADDIATIAKNVSKPLSVNMGFGIRQRSTTPLLCAAQLQDLGVAVVIYPRLLTACAVMGMQRGLDLLQQSIDTGKVVDRPDALVSFEVLHEILGMHEIEAMEQRFLTTDQLEAKYGGGRASSTAPGRQRHGTEAV
jgi:2-methylisocitrate lyase-like PEP mutase family enzyme